MGFRLNVPDVVLVFDNDALPGGLAAWGEGELEVVVDGTTALGEFLDTAERMASAAGLESGSPEQVLQIREAMLGFGARIKSWNIEGIEAGAGGFMKLPIQLALAIFGAWQKAAQPDPTSRVASVSGAP